MVPLNFMGMICKIYFSSQLSILLLSLQILCLERSGWKEWKFTLLENSTNIDVAYVSNCLQGKIPYRAILNTSTPPLDTLVNIVAKFLKVEIIEEFIIINSITKNTNIEDKRNNKMSNKVATKFFRPKFCFGLRNLKIAVVLGGKNYQKTWQIQICDRVLVIAFNGGCKYDHLQEHFGQNHNDWNIMSVNWRVKQHPSYLL